MIKVGYQDVRYQREQVYQTRLQPLLRQIKLRENVAKRIQQQETEFFKHLSYSVKIDTLPQMAALLSRLNDTLQENLIINLFLLQSPVAFAAAMPRDGLTSEKQSKEIIILVSQHFINELSTEEQLSILGHEVAHLLYGHMSIPGQIILKSRTNLGHNPTLKSDALKWMICAEISCDILAFINCASNEQAFISAMLKFTTGLSSRILQSKEFFSNLRLISFQQLDDIHKSSFDPVLSTHPLTPLRLKLASLFKTSDIINVYDKTISTEQLSQLKSNFNSMIDTEVSKIYPDIVPEVNRDMHKDILFDMCLAVAIADGKITPNELVAISRIVGNSPDSTKRCAEIIKQLTTITATKIAADFISSAVKRAKDRNLTKPEIVRMIKTMLIVAASDRILEDQELDIIYQFGKEFGITPQDLVMLVHQFGLR